MLLDFLQWMFINVMVSVGLVFLAAYPPFRTDLRDRTRYPWQGVALASLLAVFSMQFPWVVGPGQQIDIRMVPLGLVGWTQGLRAAIPVGLVIIGVRYWMGGPGAHLTLWTTLFDVALVPLYQRLPRNMLTLAAVALAQVAGFFVLGQNLVHPQPPGLEPTSPFWLLIAAVCVISMWLVYAAGRYVGDRHSLERKLAAELRSKEAVLELIPYGILFLDERRQVTQCNQAACHLLKDGQVPLEFFMHPEVDEALRQQRRITGCRVTYASGAGCERIVLISAVPLEGGGAVLGIENVTTVIRQEREEARRDRLELLGRLAAMAAHEIKNPLTTIKGFIQLLGAKPEFAAHRSSFALVQSEAEHINQVVNDFLVLAANSAHQPTHIDLDDLLRELVGSMAFQFPATRVRATLEGESGIVLEADRNRLWQILKNLTVNAYEAMDEGGELTLQRERRGGAVMITVIDSGPGIAPELLPLVFTPYTTTKATGTGLGLVISNKLAAEMGGQLEILPREGEGCAFRLTLPLSARAAQQVAAGPAEAG